MTYIGYALVVAICLYLLLLVITGIMEVFEKRRLARKRQAEGGAFGRTFG